jgi:hypothetical protein
MNPGINLLRTGLEIGNKLRIAADALTGPNVCG